MPKKGYKQTEEHKKKLSILKIGDNNPMKGIEARKKISEARKRYFSDNNNRIKLSEMFKGSKNWNWKGGKSFELYGIEWTDLLKHSIRTRDCFTCKICKGNGWVVHHIDYNKKNCSPENLITLCQCCHSRTNHNRDYWIDYFKQQ